MAQRSSAGGLLRDPVLLGMGGLALAVPVWFLAGPGGAASSWAIQAVLDVAIVVFARRLGGSGDGARHNRRFWRAMAVAGLLCAVGDGTQTALVAADPAAAVSIVQSMCVVCAMTIMAVVMLRHPLGRGGRQRVRLWLDASARGRGRPTANPTSTTWRSPDLVRRFAERLHVPHTSGAAPAPAPTLC